MPSILTLDDLMEAARQCARGVRWKDSIAGWTHPRSLALNCLRLKRELDACTYRLGGYVTFEVTEPKRRAIRSPKFRDRVVQRAMCNRGLYHDLTRGNIYDNGACQAGKGTLFAMDRLSCLLQRHHRRHGRNGWVLRLDIRKFFDSMPHGPLKEMVRKKVREPEFAGRVCEVVDSFRDPGIGLGSQISQLLAVSYLSGLDHYIKEVLRVRAYVRYSDDMVLVHESRAFLKEAWRLIGEKLEGLGLGLNQKSCLHPLAQGIRFLKFRFLLTGTGRVLRLLDRKSARHIAGRLRKLKGMQEKGERSHEDLEACFRSWRAHAEQGDARRAVARVRKLL